MSPAASRHAVADAVPRARAGLSLRLWRRVTRGWRLKRHARKVDALLASYPKSGRTWFRFLLSNYFGLTSGEGAVTLHGMFARLPNFDLDELRGLPASPGGADRTFPLIAAVHKPYSRVRADKPVIFLIRDPRDVMVSAFFHATKHKKSFVGDYDEFIRDEILGLPAFIRYVNSWAGGLEGHRHVVLTYEELSRDASAVTARVLDFLGVPVDWPALRKAEELSRFDAMRTQEKREGLPKHDYDRRDEEALRMRRGKAGGYRDYLSALQVERMEQALRAQLTPPARALVEKTACKLSQVDQDDRASLAGGAASESVVKTSPH